MPLCFPEDPGPESVTALRPRAPPASPDGYSPRGPGKVRQTADRRRFAAPWSGEAQAPAFPLPGGWAEGKLPCGPRCRTRTMGRTLFCDIIWPARGVWAGLSAAREAAHSPITVKMMSRTRLRVSHSTRVKFCQGPITSFPSTKGAVMKGERRAALMWDDPLSSCQVSWCQ